MPDVCPYYHLDSRYCNFFMTNQDERQRENYCLTSDNWKYCENYKNRSDRERIDKRLR